MNKSKPRGSRVDLLFVILTPIMAAIISRTFHVSFFMSEVLFFGIPALYLSLRAKEYIKKIAAFSLITAVPTVIIVDYICQSTLQWVTPNSIINNRLFGHVSVELILWGFINFYFIILFYEYFIDHRMTKGTWPTSTRQILKIVSGVYFIFLTLYGWYPSVLHIPYFYFLFGMILFVIPLAKNLWFRPQLIPKILPVGIYFFFHSLLYELVALKEGWWIFPGTQFIGHVTLLDVTFPFEEYFFWITLCAMAVVISYERLVNTWKKG